MNCKEFEIEWSGLDDSSRLTAGMEDHRLACTRCSGLIEDLKAILEQARQLHFAQEPPERVWVSLRNQLELEGLIREPVAAAQTASWRRAPATRWLFRLPA